MRPESKQNIFRQGDWGLVANLDWDCVMSTDGKLTVDLSESRLSFIFENWKPTVDIELAYRLTIDDEHEIQSPYRKVVSGFVAHYTWRNLSDEFITALEEGNSLEVSLIDKDEEEIYVKAYLLAGFAENVIAFRKLQKDSPRVERED